jgi:hypothetical protein
MFINDCLGDLLTMFPLPPRDPPKTVVGEITVTDLNSGKISEHVLH